MIELIIVGGGGFSKEVAWLAKDIGKYSIKGILNDNAAPGTITSGISTLGGISEAVNYLNCGFVIAIGNPRTRKKVEEKLKNIGVLHFPNLIHPSVIKSETVLLGEGNIICAGAILTTDIRIGNQNIININSTVGHDSVLGNYVTVAPLVAISGNVTLNDLTEVGTGASIRQGLTLEHGSMLGMGSVLTKNMPENQIFVGNPAKFLKIFE